MPSYTVGRDVYRNAVLNRIEKQKKIVYEKLDEALEAHIVSVAKRNTILREMQDCSRLSFKYWILYLKSLDYNEFIFTDDEISELDKIRKQVEDTFKYVPETLNFRCGVEEEHVFYTNSTIYSLSCALRRLNQYFKYYQESWSWASEEAVFTDKEWREHTL